MLSWLLKSMSGRSAKQRDPSVVAAADATMNAIAEMRGECAKRQELPLLDHSNFDLLLATTSQSDDVRKVLLNAADGLREAAQIPFSIERHVTVCSQLASTVMAIGDVHGCNILHPRSLAAQILDGSHGEPFKHGVALAEGMHRLMERGTDKAKRIELMVKVFNAPFPS